MIPEWKVSKFQTEFDITQECGNNVTFNQPRQIGQNILDVILKLTHWLKLFEFQFNHPHFIPKDPVYNKSARVK